MKNNADKIVELAGEILKLMTEDKNIISVDINKWNNVDILTDKPLPGKEYEVVDETSLYKHCKAKEGQNFFSYCKPVKKDV